MRRRAVALSAVLLAGCTNLGAVADISGRLTQASTVWDEVGGDFARSCERERTLNPMIVDCEAEKRASAGLAAANAVLTDYFEALGAAANESSFTVEPGLEQAAASVGSIPGVDGAQVKAVAGLFGLLARLATESVRERTLRELIGEGGPAAQTVVGGWTASSSRGSPTDSIPRGRS